MYMAKNGKKNIKKYIRLYINIVASFNISRQKLSVIYRCQ